jgi:hypothetical protein
MIFHVLRLFEPSTSRMIRSFKILKGALTNTQMNPQSGRKRRQLPKNSLKVCICILLLYDCWDVYNSSVIDTELKDIRNHLREHEAHLEALKDGKPFTPVLTGKAAQVQAKAITNKKRKNARGGKKGAPKRRRSSPVDDDDDSMDSGSDSDSDSDSEASDIDSDFGSVKGSDDENDSDNDSNSGSESGSNDAENNNTEDDTVTEEYLEEKIKEKKESVKDARQRLSDARKQKKEAVDYLSTLKKNIAKAQKEKNAFCSLKRSEV